MNDWKVVTKEQDDRIRGVGGGDQSLVTAGMRGGGGGGRSHQK